MIPTLKKGEAPKWANSCRLVSLVSCVVKTMEGIVNEHLRWFLETVDFVPEQTGFRQFRSAVTYLSQEIKDAFQEQKLALLS